MAPEGRPRARILTIGDELLSGERVDTNGPWIAARLTESGFRVEGIDSVGDEQVRLTEVMTRLDEESELVIVTGGLGPTTDDLTREAFAAALDRPLRDDPAILEQIRKRFEDREIQRTPETNRRIARVPQGAAILNNPAGTAPGLSLDDGTGARWILLPGPPAELQAIWAESIPSLLDRWFPGREAPSPSRILQTTGIPESLLAESIESSLGSFPEVEIAYRASVRGVEIKVGAPRDSLVREALEAIHPIVQPWLHEAPSGDLAQAVLAELESRGETVALAESCTGGHIAGRLTNWPGSSAVFLGGVVAYANSAKTGLLDVGDELLKAHGAVSEAVAMAMALGVQRRFGATIALSVTGVAGPSGGRPGKEVGTVWFGRVGPGPTERLSQRMRFPGDRREVRERAVQHGLSLLFRDPNSGSLPG